MGFDIPIDDWLRKGLKDFTYYYLSKENISKKQLSKLFLCKSNVEITFRRKNEYWWKTMDFTNV